jgi:hypothetical protein
MTRQFSPAFTGADTVARAGRSAAPQLRAVSDRPSAVSPIGAVRDRRCLRYRANVAARVLAGTIGAYAVVATLGALLARALPLARPEAVMTAVLVALLLFPAVTIWAFLTRSPGRACCGVIAAATAFGVLAASLPPPA